MEDNPTGARGRGRPRGRPRGARAARGSRGGARGASMAAEASSAPAPASESESAPTPDTEMPDAPPNEPPTETTSSKANPTAPAPSSHTATTVEPARSASPAARGAAPTRGGARGGRGGRFLPRAIRRSALDREAIASQEISKIEDQEKQNERLKKLGRGGRGGGRRARGGPVNFGAVIRGGGGGFGSGISASASAGRSGYSGFGAVGGFGSTGGGGSGGGGDGSGYTYRKGMKIENGTAQFNGIARPTGPRMNTASFAEVVHHRPEIDSKEKPTPLPMGIRREDPKPAEASNAPEGADDAADAADEDNPLPISDDSSDIGDVFHNDNEPMTDDGRKWTGAEEAKRVKIEGEEFHEIDKLTERLAMKSGPKASAKKPKPAKDMDWEDRYHADKMHTQRLLFGIDSDVEDDDEETEDSKDSKESKELKDVKPKRTPLIQDGELYIFQFPPVMPPLHVRKPAPGKNRIKNEPNDDVMMADAPVHDPNHPVDLTNIKEEEEVIEEEGVAGSSSSKKKAKAGPSTKMEDQPSGYLGKLVVRKSGKISLDYGGMLFDVEMAIPISHVREAVLVVDKGDKNPDNDGYHGTAYGMGRIAGKFNAVPHWSAVKPWNVDPKELPAWGCDAAPEGTTLEDYAHLLKKKKK
ncbi:unnamed protein product [Discula destructiva]